MKAIKIFLIGFVVVLYGCTYENDEIYSPNLSSPPSVPNFQPKTNLPDTDELLLFDEFQRINVTLESDSFKIIAVKFLIDNKESWTERDDEGYYTNLWHWDTEKHSLKIEVYTNTRSNSIAENIGLEAYLFKSREWTYKFIN